MSTNKDLSIEGQVIIGKEGIMPKRILIVDDDPDAITFTSSVVEDNGYDYVSADNGIKGLALAKEENPDLVLLDLIMPGKSGMMMLQEMKKDSELRKIPVIIVSGASEELGVDLKDFMVKQPLKGRKKAVEASGEAQLTKPNAFLEKPFGADELIKIIRKVLED
ncbi:MAG: response regulator [Deltaproteobacteria bacterium]|nr:response regulator [Deltaproteobacteria bacterium]